MRRADREITDANKIDKIIMKCDCCRLGFLEEGGAYILPLNFGYTNESGTRTVVRHINLGSIRHFKLVKNNIKQFAKHINLCFFVHCFRQSIPCQIVLGKGC